ncbi:MAG: hypothetical protein AAF572_08945 [Cyanobacteria bacterium P01_B01_bin.77]
MSLLADNPQLALVLQPSAGFSNTANLSARYELWGLQHVALFFRNDRKITDSTTPSDNGIKAMTNASPASVCPSVAKSLSSGVSSPGTAIHGSYR